MTRAVTERPPGPLQQQRHLCSACSPSEECAQIPLPVGGNLSYLTGRGRSACWLLAQLAAVRPSGNLVLGMTFEGQTDFAAVAKVVRVADGAEVATLKLDCALGNIGSGVWLGDRIVATHGFVPGGAMHPIPRLAVLSASPGRLELEAVYHFGGRQAFGPGPFRSPSTPRCVSADPDRLCMWIDGQGALNYLECVLSTRACLLGPPLPRPASFVGPDSWTANRH